MVIVDDIKLASPRPKEVVGLIDALNIDGAALIGGHGENKISRSLAQSAERGLTTSETLNTYDVLRPDKLTLRAAHLKSRSPFEQGNNMNSFDIVKTVRLTEKARRREV